MALSIDVEWVSAVLLGDGWHVIQPGTFRIEEYQFDSDDPESLEVAPQKGYAFVKVDQLTRNVQHYVGPLAYMLAVRYDVPTEIVDE